MIAPPVDFRPPQLHALTGLRGLAAWLVVFYHARVALVALLGEDAVIAMGKGYLAVDLFFMLSGFVMWLNYGGRLRQQGLAGAPHFWWRRFARIWPLHALVLGAMAGFAALLALTGRPADGYPWAELPAHLLLVQNWGFTTELTWNHPAWSISTELGAYLLFPFLVLALPIEKWRVPALLAAVAGLALALHLYFALQGLDRLVLDITKTGLVRCLIEFAIGIVLARLWQEWRGRGIVAGLLAPGSAVLLAAGLWLGAPETAFVPLVFAGGLLSLALATGPVAQLFASRPLRWLGDVSYATYLAHFFAFILFKIAFVGPDAQLTAPQLGGFLALVLALSAILYHGFELPAQRWLNARAPQRIRPTRPLSAAP